jgi:uncharacterized protein YwgA
MSKFSDAMAFLQALGLGRDMDSFTSRKRTQKIVYLLKQFGADLKFGYTWYLHGPYSPELTRILFNPTDDDLKLKRELTRAELDAVNRMRNFLADDLYSVDSLELIVSLIYLIKHAPELGYDTRAKIVRFLREQKPQFLGDEIEACWEKLEHAKVWQKPLSQLRS